MSSLKPLIMILFLCFQYLSEVAEVEAWINDKMALVTSSDYGKDEDASDRLLAKNKVLETDIQTYQGITSSLAKESSRLFKLGYSDPQTLKKAQVFFLSFFFFFYFY